MADSFHHEQHYTDPLPLRRVVPQRPLTEDELTALYGSGSAAYDRAASPSRISEPGIVRPAEWDGDVMPEPSSRRSSAPAFVPSSVPLAREPYARRLPAIEDEEQVAIPMRRSRWTWAIVALVIAAAGGVVGYALLGDEIRAELGPPSMAVLDETPVERAAIAVEPSPVAISALAEPHRGPGLEPAKEAKPEPSVPSVKASKQPARPAPNRSYTYQRPARPAPEPPTTTPYPNLDAQKSLQPESDAIDDLRVPRQYQRPAGGIVRDPGF